MPPLSKPQKQEKPIMTDLDARIVQLTHQAVLQAFRDSYSADTTLQEFIVLCSTPAVSHLLNTMSLGDLFPAETKKRSTTTNAWTEEKREKAAQRMRQYWIDRKKKEGDEESK